MNFHNINLPKFIEIFATGGPEFASSCVSTLSGRELRSLDREYAKQKYLIKNCRLSELEFEQFNAFFRARKGRNFAFRFRDYADYKVDKQIISLGDGHTSSFQLFKLYDDSIAPYHRIITKPVPGSVELYSGSEEIEAEVNYENGIVQLRQPLQAGQTLIANFMFDVVVRFGSDTFEYNLSSDGSIELSNVELVEVNE